MKQLVKTGIVVLVLMSLLVLPAGAEDPMDYAKVYVIPLTVRETGVTSGTITLMYGHGPELGFQSGTFKGELADTQGKVLKTFPVWDPRVRFGDSAYVKSDGSVSKVSGVYEKAESADVSLVVPFSKEYGTFSVYNDKGAKAASVDLGPAMQKFCAANPQDPDCGRTALSPLFLGGGAVLVPVLAAGAGRYFMRKKKPAGK